MTLLYINILYIIASHIDDGDYSMDIDYGPERQRWKSVLTYDDGVGAQTVRSVRYHDDKDIIAEDGRYYSITYLDGGVICVKNLQNNAMSFYQTCADMLGNVTKIVKGDRTEIYKADYDEWGRQTVTKDSIGYIRGYTGHEMLPEFGLVNMNGRMYDPLLGRFLSPDDYVQMPTSPQGFNRYAYCMNNPMKYVDPSGELFGLATIVGFFKGIVKLFKGEKWYTPFTEAYKNLKSETKLLGGLFQGNFNQIVSRWTFELPQSVLGFAFSELMVSFSTIRDIQYYKGATYIVRKQEGHEGLTLGSFINIASDRDIPIDKNDRFDPTLDQTYMHEYGHYIQSQKMGVGYFPFIGIPSLFSCLVLDKWLGITDHHNFYTEVSANHLAYPFFKSTNSDLDWDTDLHPLKYGGFLNSDKVISSFPYSCLFGYF